MPALNFDDLIKNALTFEDLEKEPPKKELPRLGIPFPKKLEGTAVDTAAAATGLLGRGLWEMVAGGAAVIHSLGVGLSHLPHGGTIGRTMRDEFMRVYKDISGAFHPLSPGQVAAEEALGGVLDKIGRAVGDFFYEATGKITSSERAKAAAGAIGYAAGTIGPPVGAAAGVSLATKAAKRVPVKADVPPETLLKETSLAADYPYTLAEIEAHGVGRIKRIPDEPIYETAHRVLNEAAKIPDGVDLSIGDKIGLVVERVAPDLPKQVKGQIVDAYTKLINDMITPEDMFGRPMPALPRPHVFNEPITVPPGGPSILPGQIADPARRRAIPHEELAAMTPEARADALGVSPLGQARKMVGDLLDAKAKMESANDRAGFKRAHSEYNKKYDALERLWNNIFSSPKYPASRREALNKFIAVHGDMSWEQASMLVGPRYTSLQRKQLGAIYLDPGDLAKVAKALRYLGEGVAKYGAAGLVLPSNRTGPTKVYRGFRVPPLEKPDLQPGTWVALEPSVIESIGNIPVEYTVPGEHLVRGSRYGYLYTPPGTDISNVPRVRTESGYLTFSDVMRVPDFAAASTARIMKEKSPEVSTTVESYFMVKGALPRLSQLADVHMTREAAWNRLRKTYDIDDDVIGVYIPDKNRIHLRIDHPFYKRKDVELASTSIVHELTHAWQRRRGRTERWEKEGALDRPYHENPAELEAASAEATWQIRLQEGRVKRRFGIEVVEKEGKPTVVVTTGALTGQRLRAQPMTWPRPSGQKAAADAKHVRERFDEAWVRMEEQSKVSPERFSRMMVRWLEASDAHLRADLQALGEEGMRAYRRIVLQRGATLAARTAAEELINPIFSGLTKEMRRHLDEIVRARRIIQIDRYKGVGTVKHGEGTGPMMEAFLEDLKSRIGAQAFDDLNARADRIFALERKVLERLLDEGIIDRELYNKLKNLDYIRTEYLDSVDPVVPIVSRVRGMPSSVRSSGIPRIRHGKDELADLDSQGLLLDSLVRAENRIFRNRVGQQLASLAAKNPDNGIVRLPKRGEYRVERNGDMVVDTVPEGFTAIGYRENGKQRFLFMADDYAVQFVPPADPIPEVLGTILRWVSLSEPLKKTYVALEPFFAFAAIPLDILHLYFSQTRQFSPRAPKFAAELASSMLEVAKDAWTRSGRYKDAMREGMGFAFLTHEARGLTGAIGTMHTPLLEKLIPQLKDVKAVLSYIGESADAWVRLAHREHLIKQGMPSWEATAEARARLDFSLGGPLTRSLDTFIPWFAVAVNSAARVIRAAKSDPLLFAEKAGWLAGLSAAWTIGNILFSPETWERISTYDKVRAFNITFGDQLYIIDPDGYKRYLYIPLRIEQSVVPISAAMMAAIEQMRTGKLPDDLFKAVASQLSPIGDQDIIPIIAAINAYATGYDAFFGREISPEMGRVKPEDEIRTYVRGQPTSKLAEVIGKITGMSPIRLEEAASKVVNTDWTLFKLVGAPLKAITGGLNPREEEMTLGHWLLENLPGHRRVWKLTNPMTNLLRDFEEKLMEEGSRRLEQRNRLEELLFQHMHNRIPMKTIEEYINLQPPEDRERLTEHAKIVLNVENVLRRFGSGEEGEKVGPHRTWWMATARANPRVRAQEFYSKFLSADEKQRRAMWAIANALTEAGVGYVSPDFLREIQRERELLGTEQR